MTTITPLCLDEESHSIDMVMMMMMMMMLLDENQGVEKLVRKIEDHDSNFGIFGTKSMATWILPHSLVTSTTAATDKRNVKCVI
jgi:hypothetical protein